ncbi:MAG: chemotaxis protein CheW [Nitrospirae bacterium]|nr:MAG: chemotaxis protein CheW [Nitrospirota bacterium]
MSLRGQTKSVAGAGATERMLVVTSGPVNLAISATAVEGILPPEEAGAKGPVMVREITYPVTNLAQKLGHSSAAGATDPRIILCGSRGAHRGFRVDQVLGLTEVAISLLSPLPPHFTGEERRWFKGYFLYHEGVALWADSDWLVAPDPGGGSLEPPADAARITVEHAKPAGEIIELEVVDAERTK